MINYTKNIVLSFLLSVIFIFSFSPVFSQCPDVNLGNDTILCEGRSIILDAGPGLTYQWNDGIVTRYRAISDPGNYSVTVWTYCSSMDSDTIVITPAPVISLDLQLPVRPLSYFCKGEIANLSSVISEPSLVTKYEWSVSTLNTSSINVDTTRTVTLTITDQYGCKRSRSKTVEFQFPFEKDSIKLVTFDPTEDKYVVVYSKSPGKRTKSIVLYNGFSDEDSLTTRSFTNLNYVVDTNSQPHVAPSFYNIQVVDSCLNRSAFKLEKTHKAMFLKVTRKIGGVTNLEWDRYIGLPYNFYYIARGTTPGNMAVIDSIGHIPLVDRIQYTDNTLESQIFYYAIYIKTPYPIDLENPDKKVQAGPFVHSLSNLEDNRIHGTGIKDMTYLNSNFKTFPNPYHGNVNISYEIDNYADISIKVLNITGQLIAVLEDSRKEPGRYDLSFSASKYGYSSGMFLLVYMVKGTGIITRKLIEE